LTPFERYSLSPSTAFAWTIAAGGFSGYLAYDMAHYAMHHSSLPFEWLRKLKVQEKKEHIHFHFVFAHVARDRPITWLITTATLTRTLASATCGPTFSLALSSPTSAPNKKM
jgi:hypothetical protein